MIFKGVERPIYERHAESNKIGHNPLLVVPGVGEQASSLEGFSEELKWQGHNVYTFNHPKYVKTSEEKTPLVEHFEASKLFARAWYAQHRPEISSEIIESLLDSIPLSIYEEVRPIVDALEKDIRPGKHTPLMIIGHSLAAQTVTFLAFLRPDFFPQSKTENSLIILVNPAGVVGSREGVAPSKELRAAQKIKEARTAELKEKVENDLRGLGLLVKFSLTEITEFVSTLLNKDARKRMNEADKDTYRHLLGNILQGRFLQEAHDIASVDIVPFLEIIHGNGVSISAIVSDELLFPGKKLKERFAKETPYVGVHQVEGGGHYAPIRKPKEVAETVQTIITGNRVEEEHI